MTCIVGLVDDDGHIYIGADSAGVGGYSLTIRKDKKVFRNGAMVIAGTTSFRMLQLLKWSFTPPVYAPDADPEKYMATSFVDGVRECFKTGGYAQKSNEQESGGTFLVGFAGRLFSIYSDYQVEEALDGYAAVGCGTDIALGVLYATPTLKPKKRIELAFAAAEHHNTAVRGPWHIETLEPIVTKE